MGWNPFKRAPKVRYKNAAPFTVRAQVQSGYHIGYFHQVAEPFVQQVQVLLAQLGLVTKNLRTAKGGNESSPEGVCLKGILTFDMREGTFRRYRDAKTKPTQQCKGEFYLSQSKAGKATFSLSIRYWPVTADADGAKHDREFINGLFKRTLEMELTKMFKKTWGAVVIDLRNRTMWK